MRFGGGSFTLVANGFPASFRSLYSDNPSLGSRKLLHAEFLEVLVKLRQISWLPPPFFPISKLYLSLKRCYQVGRGLEFVVSSKKFHENEGSIMSTSADAKLSTPEDRLGFY